MREIKYRGICISEGELKGKWVYGDLLQKRTGTYISPQAQKLSMSGDLAKLVVAHPVNPETIGEYTGLQDTWEHDLIGMESQISGNKHIYKVQWDAENARFMSVSVHGTLREMISSTLERGGKVIGTIYEHPELLERKGRT